MLISSLWYKLNEFVSNICCSKYVHSHMAYVHVQEHVCYALVRSRLELLVSPMEEN